MRRVCIGAAQPLPRTPLNAHSSWAAGARTPPPAHQRADGHRRLVARAGGDDLPGADADANIARSRLEALLQRDKPISAEELRQLVVDKWGRSYDIRLTRRSNQMILQVMWKSLEQKSFWLTEDEYMQQLDAVCFFLNQWGVSERVRQGIATARSRGPGYTGGNGARCVSVPLDVDMSGLRSSEWN